MMKMWDKKMYECLFDMHTGNVNMLGFCCPQLNNNNHPSFRQLKIF